MARRDEYLDRLSSVTLFADLDHDELEAVAALGTDVDVEEGHTLAREGDPGSEAFLVLSGTASCTRAGEMALLIHGNRTATITATSPTSVRAFHKSEFDNLLDRSPRVAVKILRTTALRLLEAEDSPHH